MVEVKKTQNIDLEVGDIFTGKRAGVTFEEVCVFGNLLGFYGKIHTDMEYARTTPFGGVIVQGLLVLAPISQLRGEYLAKKIGSILGGSIASTWG